MLDHQTLLITDFPESFYPIVELIGVATAARLVEECSGARLFIPTGNNRQNGAKRIIEIIGERNYQCIADEYHGERIGIPSLKTVTDAIRRREILELMARGETNAAISRQMKCSEGLVWKTARGAANVAWGTPRA